MTRQLIFSVVMMLLLSVTSQAQNVGVGTTNPQFLLDVRGRGVDQPGMLNISNSNNTTGIRIISGDSVNPAKYICWSDGEALRFAFDGPFREIMRIHQNGYIGYGTQNPTVQFDIRGRDVNSGAIMHIGNSDKSQAIGIFGGDSLTPAKYICWTDGEALRLGFDNGSFDEKMRIHTNGFVGIGTSKPITALTVAGHITPDADLMYDLGSPTRRYRMIYSKQMRVDDMKISEADLDSALARKMTVDTLYLGLVSSGSLLFSRDSMVSGSNTLIWSQDSGRLGIGVTNPTSALDVSGNMKVSGSPEFGDRYFMGYYNAGLNLNSNFTGIPITNTSRKDASYTHTPGDTFVTVGQDGYYEVYVNVTAFNNTASGFGVSQWCIRKNGTCIPGSEAAMAHYNNNAGVQGDDNTSIVIVVQLSAGDSISIVGKRKSGTGIIRTESQGCRMYLKKI